jgi:NTE family protein
MVRALFEAGVRPDLFVGCSVGALNATYLAMDPTIEQVDGLEEIWRSVETTTIFRGTRWSVLSHFIRRDAHLYEPDGLRELITRSVSVTDLADTRVPVHVVTTDIRAGVSAWWSSGNPVEILTASACLPGVFPPVPIGSAMHVDGGVLCPVPVARALSLGARRVWVLDVCTNRPPRLPRHPTSVEVLLNSFALTRRALCDSPDDRRPGQEVLTIDADLPDLDPRDFSRTDELIAIGLAAGRRRSGQWADARQPREAEPDLVA